MDEHLGRRVRLERLDMREPPAYRADPSGALVGGWQPVHAVGSDGAESRSRGAAGTPVLWKLLSVKSGPLWQLMQRALPMNRRAPATSSRVRVCCIRSVSPFSNAST